MYRLLGNSGQPKEQQTPGKSIRQSSGPEQGNDRPEKDCSRYGGNNHRPRHNLGASDQCRTADRHSNGVAVFAFAQRTCQPGRFPVLSDLPIKRLTLATGNG